MWGTGPFYFGNGNFNSSGSSAIAVFGTGEMKFYGGLATFGGALFRVGCQNVVKTGCLDGDPRESGTTANTLSINGAGSMNFGLGIFTFNATEVIGIGVTFAVTLGTVNFNGSGTLDIEAPSASIATSAATGYQYIALFNDDGIINLSQTNSGTNTISGILYDPGSTLTLINSLGGAPIYAYPTTPEKGCLEIIGGPGVIIGPGVEMNLAPCGDTTTATGRGTLSQ